MNILIPHSWLCDYIKTDASPEDIAKALSLHAFTVEKITPAPRQARGKPDGDVIYEIEITPNRGDALSVLGIARELKAILPKQGIKAEWSEPTKVEGDNASDKYKLEVVIKDKALVPRFSALVLEDVQIKDSPDFIKERLAKVNMRALNSVIDITNYLMFDKGQPMHAFDYDKIMGAKMILRESRRGEKLVTLDGMERELPEGVIVIEDNEGRLIDLCGIMGAKNSEVDENTKRVLLFVQAYDPVRIRKSSMSLGHRTEAALRFEKGIDFAGVIPALWEAVELMKKYAGAKEASKLIDIVNADYRTKKVPLDYAVIDRVAGKHIEKETVDRVLLDLGFVIEGGQVIVPSWRYDDIAIPEDLAEEVIRLYGYYNIPDKLLTGEIPDITAEEIFFWEDKVKDYLKYQGFFECYTNSATSEERAGREALKLSNPLTEDFAYLRTSLLPQLLAIVEKNKGYGEQIKIFEMAAVYLPQKNDRPRQPMHLGIISKGVDYLEFKGVIEGMFDDMKITEYSDYEIKELAPGVWGAELDFEALAKNARRVGQYSPLTAFNAIKEDLTLIVPDNIAYQEIAKIILGADVRVAKLRFKDLYKNCLTLAIEYLDKAQQISSEQTQEIRKKIFGKLEKELGVKLK